MKIFQHRFASHFLLLLLASCFLSIGAGAQKQRAGQPMAVEAKPALKLSYELSFSKPHTHLYEVTYTVGNISSPTLDLQIPTWTPGSYLQREFARNIQDFAVRDASGNSLGWEKTDKATWHITTNGAKEIRASYRVYAYELSVRTSHLDASHAYFNGASVFMYVKGAVDQPLKLKINAPNGWKVTTPLALAPDADGYYPAPNYDILVDSPAEIGTHNLIEFDVLGKRHRIAIWGEGNYDEARLKADFTKIIEKDAELFGGLPYEHYTFIIHLQPNIGGGLEHLNSTTCQSSPNSFKPEGRYHGFLGLISHEYFHAWNVKRIRPKALGPFDYQNENYTHNLWLSEGFTDYYGRQILARAGLINTQEYLGGVGNELAQYERTPGRLEQSAAEASFDAWIKYYRPDENSINTAISYYDKGAILGMLFDLEIRSRTNNSKSLDDVMRLLYANHALPKPGFTDAELKAAFEKIDGGDLTEFFQNYVNGTAEINFDQFFQKAGLRMVRSYSPSIYDTPGKEPTPRGYLGFNVRPNGDRLTVSNILAGTPGYDGGINVNDEIIAINGQRIAMANFNDRVMTLEPGSQATITFFRRDKLMNLPITVGKQPPDRYVILPSKDADANQTAVRKAWLGEK